MPILDPSLQVALLQNCIDKSENSTPMYFFLTRLRIASRNINRNINTIEASIRFKTDLKDNIAFINKIFKCKITENDLKNPLIKNFYKLLYDNIELSSKEKKSAYLQGSYQICTDKYQTRFFKFTTFNKAFPHTWYLSDTPIAILCINSYIIDKSSFNFIKLEIDLMAAANYTVILCVNDIGQITDYLFDLILTNQFSEIHFNVSNSEMFELSLYKRIKSSLKENFETVKGYFYLYTPFSETLRRSKSKLSTIFQRFRVIFFAGSIFDALNKNIKLLPTKPFPYCKSGFHSNYIPIRLSNVPLFGTENEMTSPIPVKTSGIGIGYISPDDFLNWKNFRVKILFDDESNKNHHTELFIIFDDMHKIRPNLYVSDQLTLAKIDTETLNKVIEIDKNVRHKIDERNGQEFVKERIRSLLRDKKIKESLQYVAYAYSYVKSKQDRNFFAHKTQIYTAYEACKKFIFRKRDKTNKGIVFQVETGEGKTCIVCLIAAALALLNKTVHITSSNINLSKRDFEDSYKFFQLLGIQSAVLIHHNELPDAVKQKIKEEEKKENQSKEQGEKDQKDKDDQTNKNDQTDTKDKDDQANKKDKDDQDNQKDKDDQDNQKDKDDKENTQDDNKNDHPKEQDNNDVQTDQKVESNQNENENIPLFGTKSDSYFKLHSRAPESSLSECYTTEFYGYKVFRNSSRMNYSVCGINEQGEESTNGAKVIFSTFVNFECFYLKMVELCPASIQKYFSEYGLLIDEADSILIDEIANGTIVSRSMNSNAIDILKYVYDQHDKKSYEETWQDIQDEEKWSICHDLITKDHVKQMYEEIKMVHEPEYEDGKKYSIEEFDVKKKKKMNRILKKVLNFSANVLFDFAKGLKDEFTKDPNAEDDEDDDDDDEDDDNDDDDDDNEGDDDDDDDKDDGNTKITFRHIVPFSYDRNGILEPNKEFGGFVQQFIAIKESFKHENMIVNDISMSYLYISHPIFVKLYGTVCGFTGTVGNKYDKEIFKNEYSLTTMNVPRHNPNFRVKFPMILCKVKEERNQKIVSEVLEFHKRGNPVLVIFQDLKEIEEVEYMLINKGIKYINIFNGKDEIVKPDEIAGSKGAVSLGTNVCGRGTNIKAKGPPLHVIVSYYSSNTRVMNQAFGRTARQGRRGSYRVICLESQFFQPVDVLKDTGLLLNEFSIKNRRQQEFVDHFEKNRPWIFSGFPTKQKIDYSSLKQLREVKINVNRIIASNFVFPICMTKDLFLKIQVQKIFSLFNCPNSEFTWRLFQRYLRELILESWSLMINEIDDKFKDKEKGKEYDAEIGRQMNLLLKKFDTEYLPNKKEDIIPTFMFLFEKVRNIYEKNIMQNFSSMESPLLELNNNAFFSLKAGFRPYALLSESGARILSKNFKKTNFIKDPELIFLKRTFKKKFKLFSITEKIDDIFNKIFMKVNEIIGSKTFLKLFLRRTIAGCEFGFCLNLDIQSKSKDPFCIVDRDPLLVFTIFVRSLAPVLAIILIGVLIYLTSIATKVAKWFTAPTNAMLIAKKTASVFVNAVASNFANEIYENVINFLSTNLEKNISDLEAHEGTDNKDKGNAAIIRTLKNLFESSKAAEVTQNISSFLGDKFDIKSKIGDIGETLLQPVPIMRICAYLLLLIASYVMLFRHERQRIEDYTEESKKYDDNPTEAVLEDIMENNQELGEMIDTDGVSSTDITKYDQSNEKQSKTYLYKMAFCDKLQKFIDTPMFKIDKEELVQKGIAMIARGIYQYNHECIRISYAGDKRIFNQQILFYTTNKFPSIIPFVGYHSKKKKQHIFLENKGNGTLKSLLSQGCKIDLTHKLIIAYGIACAMNYLHNHLIIHRYLKPSNIFLDMNFYPYLSNFYRARQIETPFPYHLKSMTLRYSPPEFLNDYMINQNSFHLDVYSYGMILYNLITEIKPFRSFNGKREDLIDLIKSGKRPKFPEKFDKELEEWKKLIFKCWDEAPYRRPIFKNIISILETEFVKNKSIDRKIFMNYKKNVLKIEDPTLTVEQ